MNWATLLGQPEVVLWHIFTQDQATYETLVQNCIISVTNSIWVTMETISLQFYGKCHSLIKYFSVTYGSNVQVWFDVHSIWFNSFKFQHPVSFLDQSKYFTFIMYFVFSIFFLFIFRFGGTLEGEWCNYVPDIFFFSVTLFFGTFLFASSLKQFKTSNYFPSFVSIWTKLMNSKVYYVILGSRYHCWLCSDSFHSDVCCSGSPF